MTAIVVQKKGADPDGRGQKEKENKKGEIYRVRINHLQPTPADRRKQDQGRENGQNSNTEAITSGPGRCVEKIKRAPERTRTNKISSRSRFLVAINCLCSPLRPVSPPFLCKGPSKSIGLVSLQWSLNDSGPTNRIRMLTSQICQHGRVLSLIVSQTYIALILSSSLIPGSSFCASSANSKRVLFVCDFGAPGFLSTVLNALPPPQNEIRSSFYLRKGARNHSQPQRAEAQASTRNP